MTLVDIELSIAESDLPDEVHSFLEEADARIDYFLRARSGHVAGFVPSDFVTVYRALRAIAESNLAAGGSFCEWGSGFGVVTSLAAMLEFDANGIEIDRELVDAARKLADDFGLPVEFVHGSFVPSGGEEFIEQAYVANTNDMLWIVTEADNAYEELGMEPEDFDIVFAYPWPGEEEMVQVLFEKFAATGALLFTYNQYDSIQLQRKESRRRRR